MIVGIVSFAHPHSIGYAHALRSIPGVEVIATDPGRHDPGELRGRALADSLGIAYADSYAELLATGPEAVIVTSENARHREHVEVAAAHGVHILCEKPLATTWDDGIAMVEAARVAGVTLMVAFPVRFSTAFTRLRAEYAAGRLGELLSVRGANNGQLPTSRAWFGDLALSGGGALVDHVVHIADLLDALMQSSPTHVTAASNSILHRQRTLLETAGLVTIRYANGVIAAIDCSWSQADTAPTWGGLTLDVLGTRGTASVDFFGSAVRGLDASTGRPIQLSYGQDLDAALVHEFVSAVREGRSPQPDGAAGLRSLDVVLAAQRSTETGRTVTLGAATR